MQDKPVVSKSTNGFKVDKSESKKKREAIKAKPTPTNREVADLLEMVLERLD